MVDKSKLIKHVFIQGEEYIAKIENVVTMNVRNNFNNCNYGTLYTDYYCKMFDKDGKEICHDVLRDKNPKAYLTVMSKFCALFAEQKRKMDKETEEENLALQELEEWDGIIE